MSDDLTLDDLAILQALRTLEATTQEELLGKLREGEEAGIHRVREYTEILGMLPMALDPVIPSEDLEHRIRMSLLGDETQRVALDQLLPEPPDSPMSGTETPDPVPFPAATQTTTSPWRALAAFFALCALGLGFAIWSQRVDLEAQRTRVAQLASELETVRADLASQTRLVASAEALALDTQLAEVRSQMALVTDLGTEICALLPPEGSQSLQPSARGLLFVAEDHQHWFLKAEGLAPVDTGRTYQLWFVVDEDDRPVSAGTFEVVQNQQVELGSPEMPTGTKAVVVTLEPEGGVESPTGPVVLYGDEVMQFIS